MFRNLPFLTALALISLGFFSPTASAANNCDKDILPDGSANCEYRVVPYQSLSFRDGQLEVAFGDGLHASQLIVAEDWFRSQPYRVGKPIPLVFSDQAQRYDLIGRFKDRQSGEEFIGVTPIACRSMDGSFTVPPPPGGCFAATRDDSHCQTSASVRCYDKDGNPTGRTVTTTCEGDAGSCKDCSEDGTACCSATTTTTTQSSEGVEVQRVTLEKKTDRCRTAR